MKPSAKSLRYRRDWKLCEGVPGYWLDLFQLLWWPACCDPGAAHEVEPLHIPSLPLVGDLLALAATPTILPFCQQEGENV